MPISIAINDNHLVARAFRTICSTPNHGCRFPHVQYRRGYPSPNADRAGRFVGAAREPELHLCDTLYGRFELIISTLREGLVQQRHLDVWLDSLSFQALSLPSDIRPDRENQKVPV